MNQTRDEGFTLIELLTVISLIGILSMLSIAAFKVYKQDAAYMVVEDTLAKARSALEAGTIKNENALPAIGLYTQTAGGAPTSPAARELLDGMVVPAGVKFSLSYDPSCTTASCQAQFLQVNHCQGRQYAQWIQFGDGVVLNVRHIPGAGCP